MSRGVVGGSPSFNGNKERVKCEVMQLLSITLPRESTLLQNENGIIISPQIIRNKTNFTDSWQISLVDCIVAGQVSALGNVIV